MGFHDDELVEVLIRAGCRLWLPKLDQVAPAELSNGSAFDNEVSQAG
jgi:hypothetical protein